MIRKLLLPIGIAVALVWLVAFLLTAGTAFMATNGLMRVANNFMTELKNGNQSDAYYTYYSAGLQQQMHPEAFVAAFRSVEVESWTFTDRSVDDDRGRVSGTIIMDGEPVDATLWFSKITGTWKITAFDIYPQ